MGRGTNPKLPLTGHQSFTQNVEGVEAISRVYPLAGTTCAPHPASTEATDSATAPRPKKRTRVLNDRELLVALHQKQDRHHDWLKRQMKSLLVDVNRIRNLATKNAFVAHETCHRTWKGLTICFLKLIFKRMASLKDSSLTPHLLEGLCC